MTITGVLRDEDGRLADLQQMTALTDADGATDDTARIANAKAEAGAGAWRVVTLDAGCADCLRARAVVYADKVDGDMVLSVRLGDALTVTEDEGEDIAARLARLLAEVSELKQLIDDQ